MATWIRGGRVYDVHEAAYRDADIRIEEGRIAAIGAASQAVGRRSS